MGIFIFHVTTSLLALQDKCILNGKTEHFLTSSNYNSKDPLNTSSTLWLAFPTFSPRTYIQEQN